jgi:hypothetical protein
MVMMAGMEIPLMGKTENNAHLEPKLPRGVMVEVVGAN